MRPELIQAISAVGRGTFVANTVAAAVSAPMATSCGLWTARATDRALEDVTPYLRPTAMAFASGMAILLVAASAPTSLAGFIVCAALAAAATADQAQHVLPDALTLTAAAVALPFQPFAQQGAPPLRLLAIALCLYGAGCAFAWLMRRWRGASAFGQGDVKLIAAFGLILPLELVGPAVLAGCFSAILVHALEGGDRSARIAFGLHLTVGFAVALAAAPFLPAAFGW